MNINKLLNTFGISVFLSGPDGWRSPIFKAFIQPLRYKNKLYQQGIFTPIGVNKNDVYLYIGPANHDISKLDANCRINDNENRTYIIDRVEKIKACDKVLYIWAIIRKTTEV